MSAPNFGALAAGFFGRSETVPTDSGPALLPSVSDPPSPSLPSGDDDEGDLALAGGEDTGATPATEPTEDAPDADKRADGKPQIHTDRFARKVRQFLSGNEAARAWLLETKDGAGVVEAHERSRTRDVSAAAKVQTDAEKAFNDLKWQAQNNSQAFSAKMRDPQWATFYAEMTAWEAAPETPGDDAPLSDIEEALAPTLDRLRKMTGSDLLTDADWAQLDPEQFDGSDPDDARIELAKRHERLVARRRIEAKRRPVAEAARELRSEDDRIRRMQAEAAPVVAGVTGSPRSRDVVRAEWHAAYNAGHVNPQLDREWKSLQAQDQAASAGWWQSPR